MRSIYFAIVCLCILFAACKKNNDDPRVEAEMIIGNWTYTRNITVDGRNKKVLSSEDVKPCSGLRGFVFRADRSFSLDVYYMKDGKCTLTKSDIGTYTYDAATRRITLLYNTGNDEIFTVYQVTDTELWFDMGEVRTDDPNEQIIDILGLNKSLE